MSSDPEEAAVEAGADDHVDEPEDEGGDETTEDEDVPLGSTGAEGSRKKKKKKKKKKGKSGDASPADSDSASGSNKVDKAEADKRFNKALEDARSGSEMWIKLSSCNIFDSKTKKLFETLKTNESVTSLDLSVNSIGDEGAQAIAVVLALNGIPELIELDLRENHFTDTGLTVLEGLKRLRKQLDIKTGPIVAPPSPEELANANNRDLTKGPMFRRYFQVGDQDEDDPGRAFMGDQSLMDGGISPEELWSKIDLLVRGGQRNIPELTPCLQHLMLLLQRELSTLQAHYADSAVDGSRPHIKGAVHHLATLDVILNLTPDPVMTQFATSPQPAVGTHRLWAAEVLALLLGPNNTVIDRCVSAARLVPSAVHLALCHPLVSALHTRVLRVLRACCVSKVPDLLAPLLTPGLGAGLTKVPPAVLGSGGSKGDAASASSEQLCDPVHVQLVDWGTSQVNTLSGRRSPAMGFVIELCKVFLTCCEESNKEVFNASLKKTLMASEAWMTFSAPGGPLCELCQQQEGDLCGPRPPRPPVQGMGGEAGEMAGSGMISGQEILALLQGMGAMNTRGR